MPSIRKVGKSTKSAQRRGAAAKKSAAKTNREFSEFENRVDQKSAREDGIRDVQQERRATEKRVSERRREDDKAKREQIGEERGEDSRDCGEEGRRSEERSQVRRQVHGEGRREKEHR